jgi:hypothetical protein
VLVFGYGSLVVPSAQPFVLEGWRRTWGVAMDNRVAVPGYKVYEDPETGERPAVVVCFLDLVPDPAASVTGAVLESPDLATLDRRERQYERVAVGDDLVAYAGRREGRERAARGREEGIAVIQRSYLELVAAAIGDELPPPDVPLRDLRRIDL